MSVLRIFLVVFLIGSSLITSAQSAKSPISRIINATGTTQIAPSLSGDGRHLIYTTTSNLKSELLLFYSYQQRPGKWTQPEPVVTVNRSLQINHIGGYSLSYDGNYIFFTSRKSYGIGKFDIWYCKKTGKNQWSAPVNLAKPVNSAKDDGCPSISPDGKTIYFVRCESMDLKEGKGCQLMMAKKKNQDQWDQPVSLPDYVNDGNIMSPKILPDNQTLIYAKQNAGQWDLYQTRLTSGVWSKPASLDFVNTAEDDERFVSVPAPGDLMYYSAKFKGTYDIIKTRIPEELQPLNIVYLKGSVTDATGIPVEAFIQIYDAEEKNLVQYHRTNQENSEFEFYLAAGKVYDFSIVPLATNHNFYSELIDLQELTSSSRRKMDISLQTLEPGTSFPLNCLEFENDSTLNAASRFEMSRLIKLLKKNPGTQIEIAVHRETWESDTTLIADSLMVFADSMLTDQPSIAESSLHAVDSLGVPQELPAPPPDPTEVRAEAISRYLQDRGVPEYLLEAKGYADSEPISADESQQEILKNRRVEVRIL